MFKVFLVLYAPLVNSRQRNPTLHGSLFKALRIREFQDFELVRYFVAPTWFFKRLHICWIDLLFWMDGLVWLSFDELIVFVFVFVYFEKKGGYLRDVIGIFSLFLLPIVLK